MEEGTMRVVVIGGGVAGTVSALAFRRIGAEVTVCEAYADPGGDVGSFVSLAANGLRGLEAVGCLERVRRRGFAVPRQRLVSGTGRRLGETARGRTPADPLHSVTLLRAHLVAELRDAAREAGARVVTGRRLATADPHAPGGVARARFADGTEAEADLLVGADGIWSATREAVAPGAAAPEYAGTYVVGGFAGPVPGVEPGVFTMTFGGAGAFIHLAAPDGTLWWQAQVTSETEPEPADDAARLADLRRRYPEAMPAAVLAAATAVHPTTRQHTLPALPAWHAGRAVLVGDAAHPVGSGQGASMAVEDGLALAAAVQRAGSVPGALAAFEAARRPRVTKVLRGADGNRGTKQAGPVRRRAQELVLPLVIPMVYGRATRWLFDHRPDAPAAPVPAGQRR
jgi:2-polyprenyl-6-methoxyphenol hydroxylase-like FAD-dependent oxidoreductase